MFFSLGWLAFTCCTTQSNTSSDSQYALLDLNSDLLISSDLRPCNKPALECEPINKKTPFYCVAKKIDETPLPRKNLNISSCLKNIPPLKLTEISCIPDPSEGECPVKIKKCETTRNFSVCYAKTYGGRDINIDKIPIFWGKNKCHAFNKLMVYACQQNLRPSKMSDIQCDPDHTDGECTNLTPCDLGLKQPHVCTVKTYGNVKFKNPWIARGSSLCTAKRKLWSRACRFANNTNLLKPSLLGKIVCKSTL